MQERMAASMPDGALQPVDAAATTTDKAKLTVAAPLESGAAAELSPPADEDENAEPVAPHRPVPWGPTAILAGCGFSNFAGGFGTAFVQVPRTPYIGMPLAAIGLCQQYAAFRLFSPWAPADGETAENVEMQVRQRATAVVGAVVALDLAFIGVCRFKRGWVAPRMLARDAQSMPSFEIGLMALTAGLLQS